MIKSKKINDKEMKKVIIKVKKIHPSSSGSFIAINAKYKNSIIAKTLKKDNFNFILISFG